MYYVVLHGLQDCIPAISARGGDALFGVDDWDINAYWVNISGQLKREVPESDTIGLQSPPRYTCLYRLSVHTERYQQRQVPLTASGGGPCIRV